MSLFYDIKHGIKNLIRWFPVIYNDRDWDQNYIYRLLEYKFKHMEEFFRSDKVWSAKALNVARELQIAKNLCKRLSEEDYLISAMMWHDQKFEDVEWDELFKHSDDNPRLIKYVGDSNIDRRKSFERCGKHSKYMEEQDLDYLFKHLRKHIEGWWD